MNDAAPEHAAGMMDAVCDECGGRIGWRGSFLNQPRCPRCGHRPSPAILASRQTGLDQAFEDPQDAARRQLDELLLATINATVLPVFSRHLRRGDLSPAAGGPVVFAVDEVALLLQMDRARTGRLLSAYEIAAIHGLWERNCGDRP